MKSLSKVRAVDDNWFYQETPLAVRLITQAYVKGDLLVLAPFLLAITLAGIISIRLMLVVYAIFFTVRQFGEMIYWLLQQFGDKSYRPYDFGLKKLSNNSIYIIYQLLALVGVATGITVLFKLILI
jgi:hypothetical protein